MEKVTTTQDDRLLDYLDGKLEGAYLHQLQKEIEGSPALKQRLEELRAVHRALAHNKLESPSVAFVDKVMRNINTVTFSSSLSPRNGLLLLAGTVVAAGILVAMISAGFFDQAEGLISLEQAVPPLKKYFQFSLPSIPINVKLIIKILVGLNLVLAFVVLDRTVFRPFFQRRAGGQL